MDKSEQDSEAVIIISDDEEPPMLIISSDDENEQPAHSVLSQIIEEQPAESNEESDVSEGELVIDEQIDENVQIRTPPLGR